METCLCGGDKDKHVTNKICRSRYLLCVAVTTILWEFDRTHAACDVLTKCRQSHHRSRRRATCCLIRAADVWQHHKLTAVIAADVPDQDLRVEQDCGVWRAGLDSVSLVLCWCSDKVCVCVCVCVCVGRSTHQQVISFWRCTHFPAAHR